MRAVPEVVGTLGKANGRFEPPEAGSGAVKNVLENFTSKDYKHSVNNLLKANEGHGCNISVKVHILHSHLH